MARIAFFAESITPKQNISAHFTWQLIQTFAELGHQLKVITSQNEELPIEMNENIEVIRPFKNWSLFEVTPVLQILFQFRPDRIHITAPRNHLGWLSVYPALPFTPNWQKRPDTTLHLFPDCAEVKKWPKAWRTLAELVDQRTTHSKISHSKWNAQLIRQYPEFNLNNLNILKDDFSNAIFIPGDVGDLNEPLKALDDIQKTLESYQNIRVVFRGSWGGIPPRHRNRFYNRIGKNSNRFQLLGLQSGNVPENGLAIYLSGLKTFEKIYLSGELFAFLTIAPVILTDSQCHLTGLNLQKNQNHILAENFSQFAFQIEKIFDFNFRNMMLSSAQKEIDLQSRDYFLNQCERLIMGHDELVVAD